MSSSLRSGLWLMIRMLVLVVLLCVVLPLTAGAASRHGDVWAKLLSFCPAIGGLLVALLWAVNGSFTAAARATWEHHPRPPVFALPCMGFGALLIYLPALLSGEPVRLASGGVWQQVVVACGVLLFVPGFLVAARARLRERRWSAQANSDNAH